MRTYRYLFSMLFLMAAVLQICAQPQERMVRTVVSPDRGTWNYKTGQKALLTVYVFRNNIPVDGLTVRYEVAEDMMMPRQQGETVLKKGQAVIDCGTMKKPGFLRLRAFVTVDGVQYEARGTVGYDVEQIAATVREPGDFDDFWSKAVEQARKTPLQPKWKPLPERSTSEVDVYEVSFANQKADSRMYGVLTVPKKAGHYPAVLKLPGHGVRPYNGDVAHTAKGCIILDMGIHGFPVTLPAEVYQNLWHGPLEGHHSFNLTDRDKYYYKRVMTGLVRAIDFLYTLPQFNGVLGTFGGSQGGGLSIMTAALDSRVKALVAYYPAMCDMEGYAHQRAGGWPHTLKNAALQTPQVLNTVSYFDAVNFARRLQVPGFYTLGYNDMVCPPTSTFSALNAIKAEKTVMVAEPTEHYAYKEQGDAAWRWILGYLQAQTPQNTEEK